MMQDSCYVSKISDIQRSASSDCICSASVGLGKRTESSHAASDGGSGAPCRGDDRIRSGERGCNCSASGGADGEGADGGGSGDVGTAPRHSSPRRLQHLSRHIGAALNSEKYLTFYVSQGKLHVQQSISGNEDC